MITAVQGDVVPLEKIGTSFRRYLAIDVLRGITVALMIIVNSPGNGQMSYGPLKHAVWHGFTITDLVFPTFLFVVGNAMSFTLKKFDGNNDKAFLTKVFRRTLLIFLIGVFLNAYPFFSYVEPSSYKIIDFSVIRVVGVLQRIALCYCVASFVIYFTGTKGAALYCFISLLGYWIVLYLFGGRPDPFALDSNAASKLDIFIIGARNMYHGDGLPFDPEGLLSTIPAVTNVIAGFFVGQWIQRNTITNRILLRLISIGAVLIVLALIWNTVFPINKKIWTSSYVVLTVGLDILIMAVLLYIIEVAKVRRWTWFFEIFGKNPLTLYVLSYLIIKLLYVIHVDSETLKTWIYAHAFLTWSSPMNASLLFAISVMLVVWAVGYWMDKKRIYLKV
jgi:predicted acyltransferase